MPHRWARDILIVEDDAAMRDLLQIGFRRAGFSVRTAESGVEALAEFRRLPAAAVVSDLMLPDADGLQTISAVKADRPATPVVAISGGGLFSTSDLLAMARSVGADAAIAKPFRIADVIGAISTLLSPPLPELAA